ncbi:hypothetical protein FEK35_16510 [Nocardia cyriacigeorgica]|uniref:Uncharacterized protein n=1 Tax=Nocardia cyriacigeorgica TaxID=135487 RepID=A0A5R8PCS1_9NOCA|nr:hypothetical protein [Nocardia cyriacigeorgica]TLG08784.1 hypothetical protein FEK35_16510 [Nocardia cyriacigeorgica]
MSKTAIGSDDDISPIARRYVDRVCRMQDELRFHGLAARIDGVEQTRVVERHGVTTVVARTCDIPHRYLLGIAGFRLAQYVRLGFMSAPRMARDALFCEPLDDLNPDDWHIVCLDSASGEILGYLELAGNGGPAEPVRANPGRRLFPVEEVHGIDIFELVDAPRHLSTENVREVKRMVHNRAIADRRLRYRVSVELILGTQWVAAEATPAMLVVVGDAEAHVALRHIATVGLNPIVLSGTDPRLPDDHLLGPCYRTRSLVEPFYGEVPGAEELAHRRAIAEKVVSDPNILANLRLLVADELKSRIVRTSISRSAQAV